MVYALTDSSRYLVHQGKSLDELAGDDDSQEVAGHNPAGSA